MMTRRILLKSASALALLTISGPLAAQSDEPMPVVATFSILGDMVEVIGGDAVTVTTLVGPDGDGHVFQPTPADAVAVSEAELLFVNGMLFEGWIDRLVEASDFGGTLVVATDGIEAIAYEDGDHDHDHDDHEDHDHEDHGDDDHDHDHEHEDDDHDHEHEDDDHDHDHEDAAKDDDHDHDHDHEEHAGHDDHDHGEFDPHAWQSLGNGMIYAENIAEALAAADPENADLYRANAEAYIAEMQALDAEIRAMMEAIPEDARTVVTSHDAFAYFGRDYGLTFRAPQGVSTEAEASAQDVAALIEQMRAEDISAVFLESITDSRLLEQIASETGAAIGGTLYPGALSEADGPAPTYLDMMRHNAMTISSAIGG